MVITELNGLYTVIAGEGEALKKRDGDGTANDYSYRVDLARGGDPYRYYPVPKEEYLKAQEEERAKAEQMMAP